MPFSKFYIVLLLLLISAKEVSDGIRHTDIWQFTYSGNLDIHRQHGLLDMAIIY